MPKLIKPIKPLLAVDVQEDKLPKLFPLYGMPKTDGCRILVQNGVAYARSLKNHENKHVTSLFSNSALNGIDAEATTGSDPTAESLCRLTSGDMRRIEGKPDIHLWCFDYVTEDTVNLPYSIRYNMLVDKVLELNLQGWNNIHIVPIVILNNIQEYEEYKQKLIALGYEGVILRSGDLAHKEGRSSKSKVHLWRWKPFMTAEILVTGITEGNSNNNAATTNELGRTTRSTNQENLTPNGLLGSIQGTLLADLLDISGNLIAKAGTEITVSPGETTLDERKKFWDNPSTIVGHIVEFEYFAFGCLNLPRYPTFKCIRSKVNL